MWGLNSDANIDLSSLADSTDPVLKIIVGIPVVLLAYFQYKQSQETAKIKNAAKSVEQTLTPNGGSSIKDQLNRIEERQVLHDRRMMRVEGSIDLASELASDTNIRLTRVERFIDHVKEREQNEFPVKPEELG